MDAAVVVDHHQLYGYGGGGRIEVEVSWRTASARTSLWYNVVVEMIAPRRWRSVVDLWISPPRDWDRGGGGGGHYGGGEVEATETAQISKS
jgi:hypothetical protein